MTYKFDNQFLQITITVPSRELASAIANALVEQHLAACVQINGPVMSIYHWQGKIETTEEWVCKIKSIGKNLKRIIATVKQSHPYQIPEIIAMPIIAGNETYLNWVAEQTKN